jgi:Uma2 family endonuclease
MSTTIDPPVQPEQTIHYPESDGQPMAENTRQFRWIVIIKENLEALFQDRDDVFVAGDLLWYPVEGHTKICRAPDAMVVFGRPKGDRGSYQQWDEDGIGPQVVFEVQSPSNTFLELLDKLTFYERYGVEEYYLYDPDPARNALAGFRRQGEWLRPIGAMHGWVSPRLGIRFDTSGEELQIFAPDGQPFVSFTTLKQQRQQAEQEREAERTSRRQAEQRAAQAEQERETERTARELAEQRAAQLAARLRELGIDPETPATDGE